MICLEEIEALEEILRENKENEIKVARSFLEDVVREIKSSNQKNAER